MPETRKMLIFRHFSGLPKAFDTDLILFSLRIGTCKPAGNIRRHEAAL